MDMFFSSILTVSGSFPGTYFLCFGAALVCGLITAVAASIRSHASKSFLISLVLLPMIVATVIMMVNGSIGTGVAVMGAFSLIRFRSVPGKARDIAAIFISMTSRLRLWLSWHCAGVYASGFRRYAGADAGSSGP